MDEGAEDCGHLGARRASPSLMQDLTQGRGQEWSPEVDRCLPFVKLCVYVCVFGSWPHYYLQVLSVMVGVGTYCNHFSSSSVSLSLSVRLHLCFSVVHLLMCVCMCVCLPISHRSTLSLRNRSLQVQSPWLKHFTASADFHAQGLACYSWL